MISVYGMSKALALETPAPALSYSESPLTTSFIILINNNAIEVKKCNSIIY